MNWYAEYKKEWREIIKTIASEIQRTPQMVEKDVIQTLFLNKLSTSSIPFVFKGGTSLSKVYNLIKRFSEDIDLSASKNLTQSERKQAHKTIIATGESIGLTLVNPENVFSNHDYNKYIFEYKSLLEDKPQEIIVETSYFLISYPCEKRQVHSFVSDFCINNSITLPVPFVRDFTILTQSIERTFIDKIFAVCDYYIQDMQDRDSRHLYDICKLLNCIKLNSNLTPLIQSVRKDRLKLKNNVSAKPEHNITAMLKEIISSKFYESDYKKLTSKLLYEDISYDVAIQTGINIVADSQLF